MSQLPTGQSPFFPMPMPWWPQHQQSQSVDHWATAPARVQVALRFLHDLTIKTQDWGFPAPGVGAEPLRFDGQQLTNREKDAQAAACLMLERYFDGTLSLNFVELSEVSPPIQQAQHELTLECPACKRKGPNRECAFCLGVGVINVYTVPRDKEK